MTDLVLQIVRLYTRQLASKVMAAKGLDTGDTVLAKAVAGRLIHRSGSNAGAGISTVRKAFWRASLGFANVT